MMARELNLGNPNEYYVGGLLHDVGKISMPDTILKSSRKLTEEERKLLVNHVIDGYSLLEKLNYSNLVLSMAKLHHERLDGSGYLKVTADDLPIEARVIGICDTYDAIVSNREYVKVYRTREEAFNILRANKVEFDQPLVEEFINLVSANQCDDFNVVGV